MKLLDDSVTPSPRSGVDYSALPINPSPEEYFVLSRIDGGTTLGQLCNVSGLGREKTLAAVENLLRAGLINVAGADNSPAAASSAASAASFASSASSASSPSSPSSPSEGRARRGETPNFKRLSQPDYSLFPQSMETFEFDLELLSQAVELSDERKREVLCIFAQLDHVDYYQLFGVARDAGRKEIRGAYFTLSKRFHPDLFFGKMLGDYELMIEKLFQRTTKAYQVLSNRNKRAEYDELLSQHEQGGIPAPISTPATAPSEPTEEVVRDRKREMAFLLLVKRGDARVDAGDVVGATAEFRKALRLKHDRELALRAAQLLVNEALNLKEAALFARAALKIDRECIDAMMILGEIYELEKSLEDAIYHYQRVLEVVPEHAEAGRRLERLRG